MMSLQQWAEEKAEERVRRHRLRGFTWDGEPNRPDGRTGFVGITDPWITARINWQHYRRVLVARALARLL